MPVPFIVQLNDVKVCARMDSMHSLSIIHAHTRSQHLHAVCWTDLHALCLVTVQMSRMAGHDNTVL